MISNSYYKYVVFLIVRFYLLDVLQENNYLGKFLSQFLLKFESTFGLFLIVIKSRFNRCIMSRFI